MAKPCMHYGIPCEAGTEGNCVCRQRFFSSGASRPRGMLLLDLYPQCEAPGCNNRCISGYFASQSDAGAEPR